MRWLRVLFGTLLLCLGTAVVPVVLASGGGTAFAAGTSGSIDLPQPFSTADLNNVGANDTSPTNQYLSTRNGSPSMNGQGNGNAYGKPCAGCVGKADNKNPPGQYPNGSDANAGYECDTNSGIGKSNPAHTGCVTDPCPAEPTNVSGPSAWVSVGVSTRFDNPTFQDSGATAAPGQKIQYLFCYGNNGSTTLSNVTLNDPMAPQLVLPFSAIFALPAGASIVGGTPYNGTTEGGTLTDNFGTLAPGQFAWIEVVMSIAAQASGVITNTPTLSATGLTGSVTGNQVTTNVGYSPNLPALGSQLISEAATGGDTFTMTWRENEAALGGTAYNVQIKAVSFNNGVVVTTSFPILLGDLAPGTGADYTLDANNPNGVTSASLDILEQATGADGHLYYFD